MMRRVKYGERTIEYLAVENASLSTHYITVDGVSGVTLKGRKLTPEEGDKLVLDKAKWILGKLQIVKPATNDFIVTGTRLPYLGRTYYVHLLTCQSSKVPEISFNQSSFRITVSTETDQKQISSLIQDFYRRKAVERLTPRVKKLSRLHGLKYKQLAFRFMQKRWGSCTANNKIILNPNAMKLPYELIDYLIIHELVHTRVKDHSKRFWSELAKCFPEWKRFDRKIAETKF